MNDQPAPAQTLGPGSLVLCAGTLPELEFVRRIELAAAAGFQGISLFVDHVKQARAAAGSDAALRRCLADHGLAIAELDPLLHWLPGTAMRSDTSSGGEGFFRFGEEDFYRAADAVGARSINVVAYAETPPEGNALVDAYAGLCERAATHDLLVHLEFLPWTSVRDVFEALAIVEGAGQANGGIMLDSWHHFRSGVSNERLRELPGERILAVQLSDAPAQAEADPVEETLKRRLLPGEGDADLPGLLQALRKIGAPAPLGVEVFSEELARKDPEQVVRLAATSLRSVMS